MTGSLVEISPRDVEFIGEGIDADSDRLTADDVGAKAHGLVRMARMGLPTPPAVVLATRTCRQLLASDFEPSALAPLIAQSIGKLERASALGLGSARRPLLLAVRSGAAVSMPGMMESLLNVGINDTSVRGLIRMTGNPRLAWDSYRRLVQRYAEVVHLCPRSPFDRVIERRLAAEGLDSARDLDAETLEEITHDFLGLFNALAREPFPQDPEVQLERAVAAVVRSWNSERAVTYRRLHRLDENAGTAALLQTMVFGNAGGTSGSGVAFSRDPANGSARMYMEFMFGVQGEDLVSGQHAIAGSGLLRERLPRVYGELQRAAAALEREFADLQDLEFTVQDGRLFLLQARPGKRTPWAALRIAIDLVEEGVIAPRIAVERLTDYDLDQLERVHLVADHGQPALACAIPASIGVAVGHVALDSRRACEMVDGGTPVILVREDTSTDDLAGIAAASGILTALGGRTSHASVVARQLGKVCVVGCRELEIDSDARACTLAGQRFVEGDLMSVDGNSGNVYAGQLAVERERPEADLARIEEWRRASALA